MGESDSECAGSTIPSGRRLSVAHAAVVRGSILALEHTGPHCIGWVEAE